MDLIRTIQSEDEENGMCSDDGSLNCPDDGFLADFGDAFDNTKESAVKEWDFRADGKLEDIGASTSLDDKIQRRLKEKEQPKENEDASNDDTLETTHEKKRRRVATPAQPPRRLMGTANHLKTDTHFSDLHLSKPLLKALQDLGFESSTPIQRDVIPHALAGSDVLGTAETGSGKTGAFLLPTLERIYSSPSLRGRSRSKDGRIITGKVSTKALVLLPTRELAAQCYSMMNDLMKYTMITGSLICGGYQSQQQESILRSQPDIVICTPGRILDHLLNTQNVHLELLEIVILDEADRLLELGFREECMQILKRCSKARQTLLFSATLNTDVQDLAALALTKPIRVTANAPNKVVQTLQQEFIRVKSDEWRESTLLALARRKMEEINKNKSSENSVIIFCARKKAAHRLAILFGLEGIPCAELHGNLSQSERIEGVTKFQKGEVPFLLATDLAARGLDILGVGTVINFEAPTEISKYIHRVGRTARMGQEGQALTLYSDDEYSAVKKLGKLCSAKMKSNIVKRSVAIDIVQKAYTDIKAWEKDIKAIDEDEALERELRLADVTARKADNMVTHKDKIYRRPRKQWVKSDIISEQQVTATETTETRPMKKRKKKSV